jgi:hypothetical protein
MGLLYPHFVLTTKASATSYFRDITSGSNGYPAKIGYDLVTGLGSPLTTNFTGVVTPDFTLSASLASQSVVQGSATSYGITVTPLNGFTGSVNLSVSGIPSGATGTLTPSSTTGSSTLAVTTSATTPAGTYALTITGVSGNLARTTAATLVVTSPGFSLTVTPSSQTVSRGSSASFTVGIVPTGNNVTLSISGLPSRTNASFSPNPAGSSSTLRISTQSRTPTGTYRLTITGSGGGKTSQVVITLTVR